MHPQRAAPTIKLDGQTIAIYQYPASHSGSDGNGPLFRQSESQLHQYVLPYHCSTGTVYTMHMIAAHNKLLPCKWQIAIDALHIIHILH